MVARLVVAYDGTPFAGWAAQPAERTVQGELERALATVLRVEVTLTVGGPHRPRRARARPGRLLRGLAAVAAPRQRACCRTRSPCWPPRRRPDGFSARHDARSRSYVYRVLARADAVAVRAHRALWWPYPLDEDALGACAAALAGTHDFTAFTPTETYHVRFERDVFVGGLGASRRRTRVPHRGRHVHAPDEPRAGRARCSRSPRGGAASRSSRACCAGAPRSEAGRTAPAARALPRERAVRLNGGIEGGAPAGCADLR